MRIFGRSVDVSESAVRWRGGSTIVLARGDMVETALRGSQYASVTSYGWGCTRGFRNTLLAIVVAVGWAVAML